MGIIVRGFGGIMQAYGCTAEDAQRYLDLRDEGYTRHEALLMAGLIDPPEPPEPPTQPETQP